MDQVASGARQFSAPTVELARLLACCVDEAHLQCEPFDHIYMKSVFPESVYRRMLENLPAKRRFHPLRHRDALRPDGSSTRLRMYLYPERVALLPSSQRAIWLPLALALCSRTLQDAVKRKFAAALEQRFRRPVEQLQFYPVPILVCDVPGYRIGIHSDATSKAITMQFYLPRDGRQSHLGTVFHHGRDGSEARRTIPLAFLPACGYAFPVRPGASWHSVPRTEACDGERHSMMLTYYVQHGAPTWLKRRFDRVRTFFGLGPRG